MKIKEAINNGNVDCINRSEIISSLNWISDNYNINETYDNFNTENIVNNDTTNYIINRNINYQNNTHITNSNNTSNIKTEEQKTTEHLKNVNTDLVFNKQYTINVKNNINLFNTVYSQNQSSILETLTETSFTSTHRYQGNADISVQPTQNNGGSAFDHSDTDETSENETEVRVPRGIVNPNYPGFQHYAHALQDYSSNIENFYQSENEMTDDDIDVDIVDSSVENSITQTAVGIDDLNANYNNNCNEIESNINSELVTKYSTNFAISEKLTENVEKHVDREVPDLLKNVTNINNNNNDDNNDSSSYLDLNYSDTDIENNFHTKDIIGDFNKEIEDEIKQLLNYSINIEDDLEELRKDIKDSFAKPIENTINNISDVVNHVIKKLVETQTDTNDTVTEITDESTLENNQNEINIKKEINMSRPSFLYIENKYTSELSDAFLSDGKDDINIEEYDTEKITINVENTIKQLSSELRKVIPKLDELQDCGKLFVDNKVESISTVANSSDVVSNVTTSNVNPVESYRNTIENINKKDNESDTISKSKSKHKSATRTSRDIRGDANSSIIKCATIKKNMKTSVRKIKNNDEENLGSFDVYNIETAMPTLDIDAIESHLKAAKEAERRKRNDREEIRRRLAMGVENDEYYSMGHIDHPRKKPSLHSRMQNGKNLQICFMNETASDNEYQPSEIETSCNKPLIKSSIFSKSNYSLNNHPYQTRPLSVNITKHDRLSTGEKTRPSSVPIKTPKSKSSHSLGHIDLKESNFYVLQATLQTEARIALAQAKEMARLQMEHERRIRAVSPVTEMLRRSMEKANAPLASDRRRVSRQLLTDMNIAQLQVIVNELHSQIETLNENLVTLLMSRDDLHMGQDSMLVDIEDLTRYLGVKEQTKKTKGNTKSAVKRFASLVHK